MQNFSLQLCTLATSCLKLRRREVLHQNNNISQLYPKHITNTMTNFQPKPSTHLREITMGISLIHSTGALVVNRFSAFLLFFRPKFHKMVPAACRLVMCGSFVTNLTQIRSEMTGQQAKRWAKATD